MDRFAFSSLPPRKSAIIENETLRITVLTPCMIRVETGVFTEKMRDMILIYNHTAEICFDDKQIYLIAE